MKKQARKKTRLVVKGFTLQDGRLLTYAQAAEKVGVSTYTFRTWVAAGKIDVICFNHTVRRISLQALDRFIAQNTVEAVE